MLRAFLPRSLTSFISLTSLVFLVGCADDPRVQPAEKDIRKSFKKVEKLSQGLLKADKEQVAIKSSALGREFLLQAHLTSQPVIPLGHAMKSRIVFFKKKGAKLYLLESSVGHVISDELSQSLLLAEFDILKEEDGYITFDFNKGMSKIFAASEFFSSDYSGLQYQPSYEAVETKLSYLDKVTLDNERLEIVQVAQLKGGQSADGSFDASTAVVKYYLSAYRPSQDFISREGESKKIFGYFEVAPTFHNGEPKHFSMRFNENKKIIFAVSANTPTDYKQAVKDGALYWNKAFGKEIIEVVDAPANESAPSMNYNIIQWVNWDDGGFAYADAQADPRTGEVLHAQVYFTSAFAVGGKSQARDFIARLAKKKSSGAKNKLIKLGLKGFENRHNCLYDVTERLRDSLTDLLANGSTDEAILKVSQDYVREVSAHEVGHVLGLRHNFAGSHAVNYKLKDRSEIYNRYLQEGKTPEGVIPGSSVMDYTPFVEATMAGDMIKNGQVLAYDEKAIKHLYLGEEYRPSEVPTFCTDSHAGTYGPLTYIDCKRFDISGTQPAQTAVFEKKRLLKKFPRKAFESVFTLVQMGYPIELLPFILNADAYATQIVNGQKTALESLMTHGALASVRQGYFFPSELYDDEIRAKELKLIEQDFAAAGGVQKVFEPISPALAEGLYQEFTDLLESEEGFLLDQALTLMGIREKTLTTVKKFFKSFQNKIVNYDLSSLGQQNRVIYTDRAYEVPVKFIDHSLGDDVAQSMFDRVVNYTISADSTISVKSEEGTEWHIPQYTYDFKTRKASMSLLMSRRGSTIDWGWEQRENFKNIKKKYMSTIFPNATEDLKSLPRFLRQWVLEWDELEI